MNIRQRNGHMFSGGGNWKWTDIGTETGKVEPRSIQ